MSAPRRRLLGIRGRFAIPITATVLLMGLSLALFIHGTVRHRLEEESQLRSHALVSELVQRATPEAARGDRSALELVVRDLSRRQDVVYVAILDPGGRTLASSFPLGLPTELAAFLGQPRRLPDNGLAFRSEQGVVHDLASELIGGRLGTAHLGLSQDRIEDAAMRQGQLVAAHTVGGALVAALLSLLIAHLVTEPLRALVNAAEQVGTDQEVQLPPIPPGDELGRLAQAFGDMLLRLEQKQAQIDAANRLVVQAERMAVVGKLSAGVAHEIGNPLHAGRQFLEGLKASPDQAERYTELLDQAFGRIDKVIGQLLSYSSERALALEPCDVDELLHQALDFMRYDHRVRDIELMAEIEDGLPPAMLDPAVMQQVLVNLLVNALDALEGEGSITLSAARVRGDDEQRLLIAVEDSGPGVPDEIAQRLFDPFFTTKDVGQGTGLGLSVSQELVGAQGGELRYRPAEGGGARFEILLPLKES